MKDFSPLEAFQAALRRWWLIVLLTVWGGVLGWAIHQFEPPVYQAQAEMAISTDYTQTGQLTQFEEDHNYFQVGQVISSTEVLARTAARAQAQGIQVTPDDLASAIAIENKEYIYSLQIRNQNPQIAAKLANLWVEEANAQLTEARAAAMKARDYQRYLTTLETCLARSSSSQPGNSLCSTISLADLQQQMQATYAALQPELAASLGLNPSLSFHVKSQASVPSRPALFGQNRLALAGGIIGFLLGIWAVNIHAPERLAKRLSHARA